MVHFLYYFYSTSRSITADKKKLQPSISTDFFCQRNQEMLGFGRGPIQAHMYEVRDGKGNINNVLWLSMAKTDG